MTAQSPEVQAARARLLETRAPADALAYLAALSPSAIRLGLDRIHAACATLGHPERQLRVVHVAGTNGKGSTCAFLAHSLGRRYRTGLYTSPHLVRANERIRVDGQEISDEVFGRRILEVVERLPAAHDLSYFEFGTLVALWHFAREAVEVVVLETGLGGRLDATNVCAPVVTLLTSISFDHTALLGSTLAAIAGEKAGIIKRGVPVVTCAQPPEAMAVIAARARELEAPLFVEGQQFTLTAGPAGQGARWNGVGGRLDGLRLGLKGPHQLQNAALALAGLEILAERRLAVPEADVREGLATTRWPGRFEVVSEQPTLILDGAHNPDGAAVLVRALDEEAPGRPVHLVFGVLADKDSQAMRATLFPRCASVDLTPVDSPRSLDPAAYRDAAASLCPMVATHATAQAALAAARERAGRDGLVVVAGSLVLIGTLRAALVPAPLR